ncbi:MAG: DMT family transporter [Marinilabiliaceae bacterium]|nr:DMT family transporter [Marinilabiliaceae bacterium]
MRSKHYLWHFFAIFSVIVWGTTFVSTKVLLNNGLTPSGIFLMRFLFAYIVMCFFAPRKLFADNLKDELLFVIAGLGGGSAYFVAENTALGITLATNVALIVCITPILTIFLSYFFYKKEPLKKALFLGSIVALAGVSLVIYNGNFVLKINPLGDFLTILAALAWAVYGVSLKWLDSKYSVLFITRKVFFYGVFTLIPFLPFSPPNIEFSSLLKPVVLYNLLFLGIIASLLCYFLWNTAIKKIGVIHVTNYIYAIPLVTLITSYIVINERIAPLAIVGSIMILSGVYLAQK